MSLERRASGPCRPKSGVNGRTTWPPARWAIRAAVRSLLHRLHQSPDRLGAYRAGGSATDTAFGVGGAMVTNLESSMRLMASVRSGPEGAWSFPGAAGGSAAGSVPKTRVSPDVFACVKLSGG